MKATRLENKIGYTFKNRDLLIQALTHSSYAYENRDAQSRDNEQLEFLGDSVVGIAAAEFLFFARPDLDEGELSKIKGSVTSTVALARFSEIIRLDKAVLLGRGEERCGGRKKASILAGAFEALMGAVYLDGGRDAVKPILDALFKDSLKRLRTGHVEINNSKSALQEYFQKDNLPAPVYRTVTEKGPDHQKVFVVEVCHDGRPLAKAKGSSKKAPNRTPRRPL
jgi:ribonuclease III